MTANRSSSYFVGLVHELRALPSETEWVEFKRNVAEPQEIGEYISALANSAALCGKETAYLIWGIDDQTHEVVGTSFRPRNKNGEPLENYLLRNLEPKIDFQFQLLEVDGNSVAVLEIDRAFRHPVRFSGQEYIRVGSSKTLLKNHPERERKLWRIFDRTPFEQLVAIENIASEELLEYLDWKAYFRLAQRRVPDAESRILGELAADEMIVANGGGKWNITNLGAILFARRLEAFRTLRRKKLRVIVYRGTSRVETSREQEGARGYGAGFEGLISFVNDLLPTNEVIGQALRKNVRLFPELAIRELVANALIHQDFFVTGNGPLVEIFDDRMEITNPGTPLVNTDRFLNSPPQSRNESLASFMRRSGICEERGSGIDKVVQACEEYQLPAPLFLQLEGATRAVLFAPRPLTRMERDDRIRACYLHACLKWEQHDFLTNASIRQRFGIDESNAPMASRYIREAVDAGRIKPHDLDASPRYMKYQPFWT